MSAAPKPARKLLNWQAALWLTACLSLEAGAACESDVLKTLEQRQTAQSQQWLRLLHYRRNLFVFGSQADGPAFFVDPHGDRDPAAELKAVVHGLCAGTPRATGFEHLPQLPVRCHFPARERYLHQQLATDKAPWPTPACPDLEHWRLKMSPASMTLIFSSYYPKNPSSVFGHTLLRLNRKSASSVHSPLLSYGINYAATADTRNPIRYALWGLAGGFPGQFSAQAYYYKVREYADIESRDLWEYDLALSPQELEQFVDHVWELGFTYFNYYYFTENCSYHLLTALEGAVARIRPSETLPWWVIPIDSVKAVVQTPGLVTDVQFRPSLFRQLRAREQRLDPPSRRYYEQAKQNPAPPPDLSADQKALALDATLDAWDFAHFRELIDPDSPASLYKHELLRQRAALPMTPAIEWDHWPETRPDQGHGSMRYGLGGGGRAQSKSTGFVGWDLRFALHDVLDPLDGYPATSTIEFFRATGRSFPDHTRVDRLNFVNLENLAPVSWRVTLGSERLPGFGCQDCLAPLILLQGGLSANLGRLVPYGLVGLRAQWSSPVVGPQADLGFRWRFSNQWLARLEVGWVRALGPGWRDIRRLSFETRYSPFHNWAAGLQLNNDNLNSKQLLLMVYHYR